MFTHPNRLERNDATGSVLSATRPLRLVVPSILLVALLLGLGCCSGGGAAAGCCCCGAGGVDAEVAVVSLSVAA